MKSQVSEILLLQSSVSAPLIRLCHPKGISLAPASTCHLLLEAASRCNHLFHAMSGPAGLCWDLTPAVNLVCRREVRETPEERPLFLAGEKLGSVFLRVGTVSSHDRDRLLCRL